MGCSLTGYAQGVQGTKLKKQENNNMKDQKEIYFAGGCFWGTEHFLKQALRQVMQTEILPTPHTNRCVAEIPISPKR